MKNTFITSCAAALLLACPAAMAQDECATAPTLVSGVASAFNTATATVTATPAVTDALCAGTYLNWIATQQDVWFTWTAPASGTISVSTCSAAGTSYDTSIVLYSGSCGSLTAVACNGDAAAADAACQQYYSEVVGFPVSSGTQYFVRIGGYNGATGTGNVKLDFVQGVDGCVGATGSCAEPHGGLGCSDATCCGAVCAALPSCCEVTWDQSCVEVAIPTCGIYVYSCNQGAPANDCAINAQVVSSSGPVNFSNIGANSDGPGYGDSCNSGNNQCNNDVWFKITAVANGDLRASTCGTVPFDSKIAIYDMGTNPASFNYNTLPQVLVSCNDDGAAPCDTNGATPTPYASDLTITALQGRTYLVCLSTYTAGETGSGQITFSVPTPCALEAGTTVEAEPCGQNLNGGCNSTPPAFEPILANTVVEGTFWSDASNRDTDWYSFSVPSDRQVTVNVKSASLVNVTILGAGCPAGAVVAQGSGTCPTVATGCLTPGTYYVVVVPAQFTTNPCADSVFNKYSLSLQAVAPASPCPVLMDSTCQQPGPDTVASSASVTLSGNFGQGCATGCGNGTGGTADVIWATVFSGSSIPKQISCINMGVAALRSQTPTGGACGYYASTIPVGAKVILYRDIDGGAPVNVGTDLQPISTTQVSIAGGVYLGNLEFDPPLCLDTEISAGQTLVVALSCYNLFNGTDPGAGVPSGSGYRSGIALTAVDPALPSNIYNFAPLCGATAFAPVNYTTATNRLQWAVELNGQLASCSTNNCPADLNGDGAVNGADLGLMLGAWGACPNCAADLNDDGVVNGADLGLLLGSWGPCV